MEDYPYPRTKKAYLCGHKDEIGNESHPESPCQIIEVENGQSDREACYKYYLEYGYLDNIKLIDIRARRKKEYDKYLYIGEHVRKDYIERTTATNQWRKTTERMVKDNPNAKVYIISNEHRAYWRPDGAGYTNDQTQAGIYFIEDAWDRTRHCDISKGIQFIFVNK